MLYMVNPPHPGEILKEDFINELDITITDTAKKLGVTRKTISDIVNQKAGISPEMSIRLSKAFGTDEDYWYMLQVQFDMANARKSVNLNDVEVIHKAS